MRERRRTWRFRLLVLSPGLVLAALAAYHFLRL